MENTSNSKNNGTKLGIDIGGTSVKFAIVQNEKIVHKSSILTEKNSCEKFLSDIAAECNKLKTEYKIDSVGVGTPGAIKHGLVTAINIPFNNTNLKEELESRIDLPVKVDNDANCAAYGEFTLGIGKDYENMVMVTLGTGVGGGIITNGKILHSKHTSGEIGHIIVQTYDGLPCPCGQKGCWEQYASVTALIREATKAAVENPDSKLFELLKNNSVKLNGKLIFEAISSGCPVAMKVFDKYIDWLAVGVKSLINIFGPDAIVFAGGITNQGDILIKPLRERVNTEVILEISVLQSDAGVIGAAML